MANEIRTLRVEEFDTFMRYVERAFGHSKGFFQRAYPHLYQPTEEACSWAYVIEEDGEIVSHVGLYPIETVTAGVHLKIGGIGAVSTAPKSRGKGYMTQLLQHVIREMRRIGYPVSWLGGDRQRYNSFGWELASPVYTLRFSRRSLDWAKVEPTPVEEVLAEEALATVAAYQAQTSCYPVRPHLDQQLQRTDLRFWISDDGYAIVSGQFSPLELIELVSVSGNEIGMIRALMDWVFADRLTWNLSMWDTLRVGRLMPFAASWSSGSSNMYRVNDLTQLLRAAQPLMHQRAAQLRDFQVCICVREHDRTTATTLSVHEGVVAITEGRNAAPCIELGPVEAARLFLGGPPIAGHSQLPEGLLALLPVPAFVAPMEYV